MTDLIPIVSLLLFSLIVSICTAVDHSPAIQEFFSKSVHTNNWAVLVSTSRFWFNYRHVANVLSFYQSIKRLGIPDSNIILMLADNIPCNSRNPQPGTIFNNAYDRTNLYLSDIEVDYRGYEVTAANFVRLLTDRLDANMPRNKRLLSDQQSNVLIYLTGHGGDGFLKFQDAEELTEIDLADAIETMHEQKRYNELFVIADTCRSSSMYRSIISPNVVSTSSSLVHEDSLSHHIDSAIGVYIIDRYAFNAHNFIEQKVDSRESNATLNEYLHSCPYNLCLSTTGIRTDLFNRDPNKVRATDFFGSLKYTQSLDNEYDLETSEWEQLSSEFDASSKWLELGKDRHLEY
ncbi:putative GPI-anchor transamidase [Aphelenchoides besseyi]|nr:putative GPI-anchor transamidase [Aphelenchoides besseyi]KAI6218278.1 putative GPI-anchor transamidase [Aphelenchoides besseyi]